MHYTEISRRWLLWVGGLLLSLFIYLHFALPFLGFAHLYNSNIAIFGAITGVGLAAAPLATVREVMRTRDASSIPSTLVLMQFIQFFSWTVYGWVVLDWSTFANNFVGVILGSFQLFLIGYFGEFFCVISPLLLFFSHHKLTAIFHFFSYFCCTGNKRIPAAVMATGGYVGDEETVSKNNTEEAVVEGEDVGEMQTTSNLLKNKAQATQSESKHR